MHAGLWLLTAHLLREQTGRRSFRFNLFSPVSFPMVMGMVILLVRLWEGCFQLVSGVFALAAHLHSVLQVAVVSYCGLLFSS